jgi:uncharacterized membrane protein
MNSLSNAKIFGGIGAILLLIGGGFMFSVGSFISIVGLILVFIAVKSISQLSKDDNIFNNYLYHFILNIIAIVAVFVIMIIGFGAAGGFSWLTELQYANITDFETFMIYFEDLIVPCLSALIIGWILYVISALYLRKSYNSITEHTGVGLFRTTGTAYFIGSILIIVGIGVLILFIARILEIIAYFSLPDDFPKTDRKGKSERRCPDCDRIIPEDAISCPYCGKKYS